MILFRSSASKNLYFPVGFRHTTHLYAFGGKVSIRMVLTAPLLAVGIVSASGTKPTSASVLPVRLLRRQPEALHLHPSTVTMYQKRISGPLLDRIDIHKVPRPLGYRSAARGLREAQQRPGWREQRIDPPACAIYKYRGIRILEYRIIEHFLQRRHAHRGNSQILQAGRDRG